MWHLVNQKDLKSLRDGDWSEEEKRYELQDLPTN